MTSNSTLSNRSPDGAPHSVPFAAAAVVFPLGIAFALGIAAAPAARAEDFFVPTIATPTLQDAVDDAALNADPENFIYLGVPVLFENVTIGGDFDAGHRLTIAPDGGAGLVRASVSSAAPNLPVFALSGAPGTGQGWVTLQDLTPLPRRC